MLEGHYPVRVTAVLGDCWASVGLVWLTFLLVDLSNVRTAFFHPVNMGISTDFKATSGNESVIQGKDRQN